MCASGRGGKIGKKSESKGRYDRCEYTLRAMSREMRKVRIGRGGSEKNEVFEGMEMLFFILKLTPPNLGKTPTNLTPMLKSFPQYGFAKLKYGFVKLSPGPPNPLTK